MNTHDENIQAQALDAYLTALQSGKPVPHPIEVSPEDVELLEDLFALAESSQPSQAFAAELEKHLKAAAQGRSAARQSQPWQPQESMSRPRGIGMNRIFAYTIGAAALILLALVVLFVLPSGHLPGTDDDLVQGPTPGTATSIPDESAPTPTTDGGNGMVLAPDVATPTWPDESPLLPRLSDLFGGGFGGGGGGSEYAPPRVTFVLNATLPSSPGRMTVYAQTPSLLSVQYAQQEAERWGLDPRVYMPLWMTTANLDEFGLRSYIVTDEPQRLYFEGTELLSYRNDLDSSWCPPADLPPVAQATATAEEFLRARNLLDLQYQIDTSQYRESGAIDFVRTLEDGSPLAGYYARVMIRSTGDVGQVELRDLELGALGEYPIISSQTAWEMVQSQESSGRIWYSSLQQRPAYTCPQSWLREYQAGQSVDVFAPLSILYPAVPGDAPHITMNGLVLAGSDLPALAEDYQQLVNSTGDSETPAHVWGEVQDAGDHMVLQVVGWESAQLEQYYWTGVIQRQDGIDLFAAEDGSTLPIPGLPPDLATGTRVYVQGAQLNDRLEWHRIQEYLVDDNMPAPPASEIQASVEQVELVYYASTAYHLSQELYANFGYRSVQPVWRFSGRTDQGVDFEVYVQAVDDSSLDQTPPPSPGQ